jgi:uncharacterized protein (DUF433 family)
VSRVTCDPEVNFGAPSIRGVRTDALRGRLVGGDSVTAIAVDFDLSIDEVGEALRYELLTPGGRERYRMGVRP